MATDARIYLQTARDTLGRKLAASDGEVGKVKDLIFEDQDWALRYLVVDTGAWLPGKRVLISPAHFDFADADDAVAVSLTRQQIEEAPGIQEDPPVSAQHAGAPQLYYGWPTYWTATIAAEAPYPEPYPKPYNQRLEGSPHLRSFQEIRDYKVFALDEEVGPVKDLLLNVNALRIRYLSVDTGSWLSGRQSLLSVDWIREVRWDDMAVNVVLGKDAIESAPEFDPDKPVTEEFETRLNDHYKQALRTSPAPRR